MSSAAGRTAAGGEVVTIASGRYTATIVGVGAALAALRFDDRDLVAPFDPADVRPAFRGATLAPWPNRVIDGRYTFDGVQHQLPLTEPERGHALHGLVAWSDFAVSTLTDDAVSFVADIAPSDAYPWRITVTVRYSLDDDGLRTSVSAQNRSDSDAPYGVSGHPYLTAGGAPIDVCRLTSAASRYVATIGARLLPGDELPVEGSAFAPLLTGEVLDGLVIDHAFTGLADAARVDLVAPDGFGVRMSWGAELPWLQICTADHVDPVLHRSGVAVEPMTCPPNAFATGDGLIRLAPDATHQVSWRIAAI